MTIPESLVEILRQYLHTSNLHSMIALGGGDVCQAAYFETEAKAWVLKWGPSSTHKSLLQAEVQGLDLLEKGGAPVPGGRHLVSGGGYTGILMDHIAARAPTARHWRNFGHVLAQLHENGAPAFGAETNNFWATIPQSNQWNTDLQGFIIEQRMLPLLRMASANLDVTTVQDIENVMNRLGELLPLELPALIHGDLWTGNVLFTGESEVYLIDPSAHFGCREQDLAMWDLFGSLQDDFVGGYEEIFPLEPEWRSRISLWKLIPLLVHTVLFGQGYEGAIRSELARIKKI